MNQRFERCNLGESVFEDVNLGGAQFVNVNLGNATFRDVNLQDAVIDDANIQGLTVFGFRVDLLIETEMDRRDPVRARLRIADPSDPASVREVMDRLEDMRAAFFAQLRAADPRRMTARPSPDEWSALEATQHMLFAEDLYLNRYLLRNDQPWNRCGLLPRHLRDRQGFDGARGEPCDDLETVLSAWQEVHAGTRALIDRLTPELLRGETRNLEGRPLTVGQVLQGLARHDLDHIRQAERALAI